MSAMKFKLQPKPTNYTEIKFILNSGHPVTAYYVESYYEAFEQVYEGKLTHIEFYGDTISNTGYKSWFGQLYAGVSKEIVIRRIAQQLENSELAVYPEMLARLSQYNLF